MNTLKRPAFWISFIVTYTLAMFLENTYGFMTAIIILILILSVLIIINKK